MRTDKFPKLKFTILNPLKEKTRSLSSEIPKFVMPTEKQNSFFQFLRYSLDCSTETPNIKDWRGLFTFMKEQALLGVGFRGIEKMKAAGAEVPREVILRWYAISEQIRQRNEEINRRCVKLTRLLKQDGFDSCILKGQGNNRYYPTPFSRMPGDIDVWLRGDVEKILKYSRKTFTCSKAVYHHIDAGMYNGVEIEIHYRPSFMNNAIHNKRLQTWFEDEADEQFNNVVYITEDKNSGICVPTNRFNRIYQMAHICNHVIHEGIGLRQFVDYYYLLKQGITQEEKEKEGILLKQLGLFNMATAVMYVLKTLLHMEDELMLVPANERLGRFLVKEIMLSGNFGQYDNRVKHGASQLEQNIERLKRDARMVAYFPSECLWEPCFRLFHFFWRLRHRGK